MRVDITSMERVAQFSGLLELLADPGSLKQMLTELKQGVAEYKALLGPVATKEAAEKYLEEAKEMLEKTRKQVEAEFAEVDKQVAATKAQVAELKQEVEKELQEAKAKKEQAENALKEAKVEVAHAQSFKREIDLAYKALKDREAECAEREASLKDKLEKLTLVLGNS